MNDAQPQEQQAGLATPRLALLVRVRWPGYVVCLADGRGVRGRGKCCAAVCGVTARNEFGKLLLAEILGCDDQTTQ